MAEPDRRPSAQEIEELTALVRRDPGSPAFLQLAEAYLALGRPNEAVEVAARGLQLAPDRLDALVLVARAHMALHQWREAQGELLRVVKIDRASRHGFALLGEVLLRRSDFERAVPVLQHAQNLEPTSPVILAMLRRARSGQPLDPPPPIPQPALPREDRAARAAGPRPAPGTSSAPRPARTSAQAPRLEAMAPAPVPVPAAPQAEVARPRLVPTAKPQNAAQASLRQSVAIGENYLNDLLTGGLLEVPGVRVPAVEYDLKPDRRWGRGTSRILVLLFALLFVGLGGGGFYWWYTEKLTAEAVAKLQSSAVAKASTGTWAGYESAMAELRAAVAKDQDNTLTFAFVASGGGMQSLLYGTEVGPVASAARAAEADITQPQEPGFREHSLGSVAIALAKVGESEDPTKALADANLAVDAWLSAHPDDSLALWLKGRAHLAAGERNGALAVLTRAASAAQPFVVAQIELANLLVDGGDLDQAFQWYDKALAAEKDHPLALLGRSLARAESGVDAAMAMDDLNVKLDKELGPTVAIQRELALALAHHALEDFPRFGESLRKVGDEGEPRFLARVALAHTLRGNLAEAARTRSRIRWYSKVKPEDDPQVLLVDAGLLLASGLPEKALAVASRVEGVRAHLWRAQALLDLGRAKEAFDVAKGVLEKAPENIEAKILREQARLVASSPKEREDASSSLEKVARQCKSKLGRHALGAALLALGSPEAKRRLEQALEEITDESPHPVVYRTRTALAELLLAEGNVDGASTQLDEALKANSGYFPALALQARLVLMKGDAVKALELVAPIIREGAVTPMVELISAEAMAITAGSNEKLRSEAVANLTRLRDKGISPTELGRIAAIIDPKLPRALELPEPAPAR
jgi:tetratricopeptide (TPR) repeat protein